MRTARRKPKSPPAPLHLAFRRLPAQPRHRSPSRRQPTPPLPYSPAAAPIITNRQKCPRRPIPPSNHRRAPPSPPPPLGTPLPHLKTNTLKVFTLLRCPASPTTVGILLPDEKRLCEDIVPDLKDECFTEAAKGCVMQLLNFGDAISICERSSEKLFRILDMYEVLSGAVPDLEELFTGETGELICSEVDGILKRLGDAVRGTLTEFGNTVQKETSRKPVQGAEIHPLTRYVMNYLKLLVDYSESLDMLLNDYEQDVEHRDEGSSESNDSQYLGSMAPLGRRLHLLISYLEANLEEKSKLYDDLWLLHFTFLDLRLGIIVDAWFGSA